MLWLWLICSVHVTFYHTQQGDKEQKFSHFVYALYSLSLTCHSILRLTAHFMSKAVQLKSYLFQLHGDHLQEKINKFYSSVASIHCTTVLTTISRVRLGHDQEEYHSEQPGTYFEKFKAPLNDILQ